jgi:non-specific serine/threonine protein kinase
MASLQELIASFRSGQIKLPAVFDALTARGAVSPEEHARDTAWLEHLRDEEGFDPRIARALLAKLASTQPASASPVAVEDLDAETTRVLGIGPFAAAGDATRVAPVPPTQDDGTLVRPRPVAGDADESATVVQPASRPTPTQTQGTVGSDSSLNASTWQRVAGESGGEYATVGMLLKGRFLLERELGRGGMGVVYLARDERKVEARDRDPYVAVKVLNDEVRRHPDSLIALQREARRSQQLAHDNIVRVYDFDKDGTIVFMTMEYIDGTSLKTLIREQAYDGMPLAKARPLPRSSRMLSGFTSRCTTPCAWA